jgi:hypothetical protein
MKSPSFCLSVRVGWLVDRLSWFFALLMLIRSLDWEGNWRRRRRRVGGRKQKVGSREEEGDAQRFSSPTAFLLRAG